MDHSELIYKIIGTKKVKVSPISGGDINFSYRIEYQEKDHFIKLNSVNEYPEMLYLEAKGLEELSRQGKFKTPKIIDQGVEDDYQYLVLEFVKTIQNPADFWQFFGENLAKLHLSSRSSFGLDVNNYIGSLHQFNQWHDTWEEFIITERFIPQLKLATDSGIIENQEQRKIEAVFSFCSELWPIEPPSLLHGDLWSGNYLSGKEPYLIDPAVYYGHREMDLGMMHLFGGFDNSLFRYYQEIYPLEKGWQERIKYNQIYPLLVHLNLFGRGHLNQILNIVKPFT